MSARGEAAYLLEDLATVFGDGPEECPMSGLRLHSAVSGLPPSMPCSAGTSPSSGAPGASFEGEDPEHEVEGEAAAVHKGEVEDDGVRAHEVDDD